ncbi:hypothetical protein Q5P01_001643 [Channa striata]|uniref:LIM zinc-binding domain-containing protein n=1 Tax=Channa striata TaxID=64152 RepID=A0AA88NPP7_CHASR|nr:hypothetical protein Q5P01_001643 [Channa striata]
MATAASPKRMVSSVFITLASPYRATVTQQQPSLQAHSAPAAEKQHTAMRVGPSDSIRAPGNKKDNRSSSDSYSSIDPKDWNHTGALALTRASEPQGPKPAQPGTSRGKQEEKNRSAAEHCPPPPHPPPPSAARPSSVGTVSEEPARPPPPAQTALSHPLTPGQQLVYNREVETKTPSSGSNQHEQSHGVQRKSPDTSLDRQTDRDVCGFCRKPVALSEPAIEALNRTYHDGCFQCRSCHIPLAGKQYYNKAGIPLCEDCYQASLELCWSCGEVITDHVIRALERAYHNSCFTCTTCKQQIGEQAFAQGEVGEVYCLQDYYRKYAPKCNKCDLLIIPKEDGTDSYTVECLGRSYHEDCYRCQVCFIQLSPEPNEHGCYPLDGKMLCKSCHLDMISGQH